MVNGYAGKYLDINLTDNSIKTFPVDMDIAKKMIGGLTYGLYLMWKRTKPGIVPRSSENLLIFSTGPISGLVGTSRGTVVFKSPLTELMGHAESGGHWTSELKFAGYDGIVVSGKAERPMYLYVKDDYVEIRDAKDLWGKTTSQTDQAIVNELHDPFVQIVSIGPAGEHLCGEACIIHTGFHAFARTGGGCVMGSKNLKAVAIRGTKGFPSVANPERCCELLSSTAMYAKSDVMRSALWGMSTFGTPSSQVASADIGRGIFRNFEEGDNPKVTQIGSPRQMRRNRVLDSSCFLCPVACLHQSLVRSGRFAGTYGQPDWDSSANLTQQCLMLDPDGLVYLNALCDDYGMDAEGVGGVMAWAMECYEKGILTEKDLDGLDLTWGNLDAEAKLLWKIVHREGIGNLLADGFKYFLPKVGRGSEKFAMQSKGAGFGGYQPWLFRERYAVNNIGGHHNIDSPGSYISDSLLYCVFAGRLMPEGFKTGTEYYYALFNSVTGWNFSAEDFRKLGLIGLTLGRAYNIREGYGGVMPPSEADIYPEKAHHALTYGAGKGKQYTREAFLADRAQYYAVLGYDEKGIPTKETLNKYGLEFTIKELEKAGAWS
jgi:aldehyde:ferredoxin oxidoreductase